jgi:hypothetical protein
MATFNLRKFSEPGRLKTIKPSRLIEFLKAYKTISPAADLRCQRGPMMRSITSP